MSTSGRDHGWKHTRSLIPEVYEVQNIDVGVGLRETFKRTVTTVSTHGFSTRDVGTVILVKYKVRSVVVIIGF